jgi:hypothetical protein
VLPLDFSAHLTKLRAGMPYETACRRAEFVMAGIRPLPPLNKF